MLIKVDGFSYKVLCSFLAHKSKQWSSTVSSLSAGQDTGTTTWQKQQQKSSARSASQCSKLVPLHGNQLPLVSGKHESWSILFYRHDIIANNTQSSGILGPAWNQLTARHQSHSISVLHLCQTALLPGQTVGESMAPCLGKVTYMPGNQCLLSDQNNLSIVMALCFWMGLKVEIKGFFWLWVH